MLILMNSTDKELVLNYKDSGTQEDRTLHLMPEHAAQINASALVGMQQPVIEIKNPNPPVTP